MKKALIIAALLIVLCATFAFSACLYPSSLHKIDYESTESNSFSLCRYDGQGNSRRQIPLALIRARIFDWVS